MKSLNDFINEEDQEQDSVDPRRQLIQMITSNFYRFINNPDHKDDRGLLFLIAAIGLLGIGNDSQTVNASKRLAQLALSRSGKPSKKDK